MCQELGTRRSVQPGPAHSYNGELAARKHNGALPAQGAVRSARVYVPLREAWTGGEIWGEI